MDLGVCHLERQSIDNVKRHIVFYVNGSSAKGDINERFFCS